MNSKKVKRVLFESQGLHEYGHDHAALRSVLPEGLTDAFKVTTQISRHVVRVYVHAPTLAAIPEPLRPTDLERPRVIVREVDVIEEED